MRARKDRKPRRQRRLEKIQAGEKQRHSGDNRHEPKACERQQQQTNQHRDERELYRPAFALPIVGKD